MGNVAKKLDLLISLGMDMSAETNFYTIIGKNMRAIREKRNMTQADIAEKLGVTPQQVQKHEKGTSQMYVHTLIEISKILKVPISLIIKTEDQSQVLVQKRVFVREKAPIEYDLLYSENYNTDESLDMEYIDKKYGKMEVFVAINQIINMNNA